MDTGWRTTRLEVVPDPLRPELKLVLRFLCFSPDGFGQSWLTYHWHLWSNLSRIAKGRN